MNLHNARAHLAADSLDVACEILGCTVDIGPVYQPDDRPFIERFFGTLDTEWAHGRVWPNSTRRDRALASFIRYYNRRRPHSAAGGRPPISRVHHVRGQDT